MKKQRNLREEEKQLEKALKTSQTVKDQLWTVGHIQEIIEEKTGIPVTKLQADEQAKMKALEKILVEKSLGKKKPLKKLQKPSVVAVQV